MKKPIITIHNTETNEVITREMTDEEFSQHKANKETQKIAETELINKAAAKSALLVKMGITEDEAKLLLS